MGDKPSYLGLLNAVALGEGRAHEYLTVWADRTDDPAVRDALLTVAAREGAHAEWFSRRLAELGYEVQQREPGEFDLERAACALSDRTDLEKLAFLGYDRPHDPDAPDIFDRFFMDKTIDPDTGALIGRYIAEERDSERVLRACYEALAARAAVS